MAKLLSGLGRTLNLPGTLFISNSRGVRLEVRNVRQYSQKASSKFHRVIFEKLVITDRLIVHYLSTVSSG